jgi:hypothetical protein
MDPVTIGAVLLAVIAADGPPGLVGHCRGLASGRGLAIGAVLEQGGDCTYRQGRYHQRDVAVGRGVEADLTLVQAEAVDCAE